MNPLEYLHLQMRLEGNRIINDRFIRQVETVPGERLPLILIAKLATGGMVTYYVEGISIKLQKELAANVMDIEFPGIDSLLDILKKQDLEFEVGHYKTYVLSSGPIRDVDVICFQSQHARVKAFGFDGLAEEVYALERENMIVSACVSTRENSSCGEAWVFTLPEYRHRGFAQKVVRAWAGSLIAAGKVPFYSHEIGNVESANLAGKLGLQSVFEEICVHQISRDEKTMD